MKTVFLVLLAVSALSFVVLLSEAEPLAAPDLFIDHQGFADHYFASSPSSDKDNEKSFGCSELVNDDVFAELKKDYFGLNRQNSSEYWKPSNASFVVLNLTFVPTASGSGWNTARNCKAYARSWVNNLDRLATREVDRFNVEDFQWPSQVLGFPSSPADMLANRTGSKLGKNFATLWAEGQAGTDISPDVFSVLVENRDLTVGIGFFSLVVECDGGFNRTYCIIFKKPEQTFPSIMLLVILAAIVAMVCACLLGCVGACFERNMETQFRTQLENDKNMAKDENLEAANEHASGKKKKKVEQ